MGEGEGDAEQEKKDFGGDRGHECGWGGVELDE